MSKIKVLLDVIDNLRNLTDSLEVLAQTMSDGDVQKTYVTQNGNYNVNVEKTETINVDNSDKEPQPKFEDVRGKLAEISQSGKTAQVRELIQKYGGNKLSDIEPSNYADVLKDAEVLANA